MVVHIKILFVSSTSTKNCYRLIFINKPVYQSIFMQVAVEFAMKGTQKVGTVFEIPFNMASRGASVQWVSQYPYENELLYPPCTYLTCEKVHLQG